MNPNQALIDSGWKFVASVSGGGQEVFGDLTRQGGMSNTLLEGTVPYSIASFNKLIKGKIDKIVSSAAARAAAMACYEKARDYSPGEKVFGFASTGSVVKIGGEREGRRHKVYMAIQDADRTIAIDIEYKPGRTREEEEKLTARCIKQALMWGCHLFGDISRQLTPDDKLKVTTENPKNEEIKKLVHGQIPRIGSSKPAAVFSSSFNPMHDGHLNIIRHAYGKLGGPIGLELCIWNADKPPLDYLTIEERLNGIYKFLEKSKTFLFPAEKSKIDSICLTNVPFFFDKVEFFPGTTFVVGRDTLDRIMDDKYYHSFRDITNGLSNMVRYGNRFLVYPRKGYQEIEPQSYYTDNSLLPGIFDFVNDFEPSDISSTQIRREADVKS